jgi:hypothetical protein
MKKVYDEKEVENWDKSSQKKWVGPSQTYAIDDNDMIMITSKNQNGRQNPYGVLSIKFMR